MLAYQPPSLTIHVDQCIVKRCVISRYRTSHIGQVLFKRDPIWCINQIDAIDKVIFGRIYNLLVNDRLSRLEEALVVCVVASYIEI